MGTYRFHREVSATLAASPQVLFPLLVDPVWLAARSRMAAPQPKARIRRKIGRDRKRCEPGIRSV
jgi:hypothetical protein